MKIQVLQENVKGLIERLARIAPQKSTLPVLQNIKIETRDGEIYFSATDLEIGATIRVSGKVQDEGAITLPASLLKDFIGNLKNNVITIETDDTYRAHVSSGKSNATVAGIDVEEFPTLPAIDDAAIVGIEGDVFKAAIDRVVFAASNNTAAQPILCGVHMRISDTLVVMEAADGFRMSQYTIELPESATYGDFIIPSRTLRQLGLMVNPEDVVEVVPADSGNRLAFRFGATQVVSRIIEGTYLELNRIIPKEHNARLIVATSEMNRTVKLSNPFDDESAVVYLDFDGTETLAVSTRKLERGSYSGTIEGTFAGVKSRAALNSKFLGETLSMATAETVSIELGGERSPIVIREVGSDAWLHMISPMNK